MSLGFLDVVVAKVNLVDVERIIIALAEELALADVCKLLCEVSSSLWTHNTITEASHSLVAEDVS
jgi:hypothetical protein